MNEQQKANLIKLAIGLSDLKAAARLDEVSRYISFDMGVYYCNMSACAVGFGAILVEPRSRTESWREYSQRVFGLDPRGSEGFCMFSAYWEDVDNSPEGAAARILYTLHTLSQTDCRPSHEYVVLDHLKKYQETADNLYDLLLKEAKQ